MSNDKTGASPLIPLHPPYADNALSTGISANTLAFQAGYSNEVFRLTVREDHLWTNRQSG